MLTKATLILFDTRGMETSRFFCAHISTDANRFRTSPFLNSGIVHACVPFVFFKPINAPTDLPPPPQLSQAGKKPTKKSRTALQRLSAKTSSLLLEFLPRADATFVNTMHIARVLQPATVGAVGALNAILRCRSV